MEEDNVFPVSQKYWDYVQWSLRGFFFCLLSMFACLLTVTLREKSTVIWNWFRARTHQRKARSYLFVCFVFFHVFICISLFLYRIFTYLCFLQFPKVEKTSILKSEHLLWKQFNTTHTLEDKQIIAIIN